MIYTFPRFLLLTLALFGDIVSVLPKSESQSVDFWFGERNKYKNKKSVINSVRRLMKTKEISKVVDGGKVKLKITPRGLVRLGTINFNLERFINKPWDGRFRSVIFDIKEESKKDRQWIRNKLKDLGFGMLQESVWISVYPIERPLKDFLGGQRLDGNIVVMVSEILVGDQKALASYVWKLEDINKKYLKLLDEWGETKNKKSDTAFRFERKYFELLLSDPFLPRDLLPEPWYGDRAKGVYIREIKKLLD